jgi:phage gpG-like protein
MLNFKFEVEGVTILNRSFSRVNEHLSDLRPIWNTVQRDFWKIEDSAFKSEGAKGASGKWKALSRPYAKQKAQRYGVKTILRASDRLMQSLTSQTGDTILIKDKLEFGIGTSLPYAPYHQRGGGKLPKRPVIDFSESQKKDLTKAIQRDILAEMKRDSSIDLAIK